MLSVNKFIKIFLKRDIKATDGTQLKADYESYFTMELSPMYATMDDVRKRIGHFINNIPDDTINQIILNNSLYTQTLKACGDPSLGRDPQGFSNESLAFGASRQDDGPLNWNYFASRYVTIVTALNLLDNLDVFSGIQLGGFKKTLGDFEVSKDPSWKGNKKTLVERLECELYKLEPAVRSCMPPLRDCLGLTDYRVRDYMPMLSRGIVRGVNFPDYPSVGRRWWPGMNIYPIGTDKINSWYRWYTGRLTPL